MFDLSKSKYLCEKLKSSICNGGFVPKVRFSKAGDFKKLITRTFKCESYFQDKKPSLQESGVNLNDADERM